MVDSACCWPVDTVVLPEEPSSIPFPTTSYISSSRRSDALTSQDAQQQCLTDVQEKEDLQVMDLF